LIIKSVVVTVGVGRLKFVIVLLTIWGWWSLLVSVVRWGRIWRLVGSGGGVYCSC